MCAGKENCECGCSSKKTIITKDFEKINKKRYTDEGFLVVDVILARPGIQEYYAYEIGADQFPPNQILKVYRPEEEVFNEESMKSFEGKPVTNEHPDELVTIDNIKNYQVGSVDKEVKKIDNLLRSELVITDKESINLVESGKIKVSNGYLCVYDFTPGFAKNGEKYDVVQRNIRGNHVALVHEGRCGDECKLILDNKITTEVIKMSDKSKMKKFITVKDEVMEVPEDAQNIVEALKKEIELLRAELAKKDDEYKKMSDEMQAYKDNEMYKEKNMDGEIEDLAEKRLEVTDTARKIIPSFDTKGKKIIDIKKAVVSAKRSGIAFDDKSDDYINGMFDMIKQEVRGSASLAMSSFVADSVNNGSNVKYVSARDKMIEQQQKMWGAK